MHSSTLTIYMAVDKVRCAIYPWASPRTGPCIHRRSRAKELYRKLEYYPCALDLETEKKKKRTWFHATEEKKRCTSPFLWKMIRLHAPCFRVWIGGYVCSTLAVSPSKKETGHDLSALTGTSVRNVWKQWKLTAFFKSTYLFWWSIGAREFKSLWVKLLEL